ncbi:expressed unknown protein [Seminavis robusta]|uniref:Uncharacterized protein n=1 Tax=Seminavis robusta TaxID=568900 RepID=A0A9N8HR77_9STRA|nr:expressed unknown protein [Seminavis robusta]|eukprot:Sro1236_g255160.1 n/a (165) ;mRNA; r:27724-28218
MNTNPEDTTLFLKRRPRRVRPNSRAVSSPNRPIMEDSFSEDGSGRIRSTRISGIDEPLLDMSGSDTSHSSRRFDDSLDMSAGSGRSRSLHQRRKDQQLFLARMCTESIPVGFDRHDQDGPRKELHAVVEQPDAESSAVEEDTPKVLVFRRRTKRVVQRCASSCN